MHERKVAKSTHSQYLNGCFKERGSEFHEGWNGTSLVLLRLIITDSPLSGGKFYLTSLSDVLSAPQGHSPCIKSSGPWSWKLEGEIDKELEEKREKIWFVQRHFTELETEVSWVWNGHKQRAETCARKEWTCPSADECNKENNIKQHLLEESFPLKNQPVWLDQHLRFKEKHGLHTSVPILCPIVLCSCLVHRAAQKLWETSSEWRTCQDYYKRRIRNAFCWNITFLPAISLQILVHLWECFG